MSIALSIDICCSFRHCYYYRKGNKQTVWTYGYEMYVNSKQKCFSLFIADGCWVHIIMYVSRQETKLCLKYFWVESKNDWVNPANKHVLKRMNHIRTQIHVPLSYETYTVSNKRTHKQHWHFDSFESTFIIIIYCSVCAHKCT